MNGGRFAVGVLIGVILAAVVSFGFHDDGETATTQTTSTTEPAAVATVEPWFMPGEARFGATAVLPVSLDVVRGVAYFDYELVGLGPSLSPHEEADLDMPAGDPMQIPESWELTTVAGATVEASTGPSESSVRFQLPNEDDEVATISVVGWRLPVPFGDSVTLPVHQGASGQLRQGTVTLSSVLVQSISTIVTVDFDGSGDEWESWVWLRPRDGRWRASGRQGGGMQLTWDGTDAPDSIVLDNVGFDLLPQPGSVLVLDATGAS